MLILGIETSCDDTSLALVEASGGIKKPRFRVLKNLVSSQTATHAPFGGVVPNLAKREHLKNLPILWGQLKAKSLKLKAIDLIAVTVGPGLEPALWTGIVFAQSLTAELRRMNADKRGKNPLLVGTNHLEGHLSSFLLPKRTGTINNQTSIIKLFPAISLIVSGGHTILLLVKDLAHWKKLGGTRDDAVGEAFDKVARIMGLPYPGGPEIEKLARKGDPKAVAFPRPMLNQKNYDFSFSGLKTSVFYYLRGNKKANLADIAASFQSAAIDVLVQKTLRAAREFSAKGGSASGGGVPIKSIMLSGGVAANKALRAALAREARKIGCTFIAPEAEYNTDNAAMIAVAGYMALLRQSYGGQAHLRKKRLPLRANGALGM
ncbi:MAG: tRNA (adenosine(37)-N6)-threonylcarbamoyltransferase complex transferase subunit TsaD [Candidatus Liptonbacteria bacterium]|nr:tRNA (adenosine(37)-N6)-threonylcarbamoyltransferase complex transferase subunit TsaD [Candidatus Liptonbacteria bacterium]